MLFIKCIIGIFALVISAIVLGLTPRAPADSVGWRQEVPPKKFSAERSVQRLAASNMKALVLPEGVQFMARAEAFGIAQDINVDPQFVLHVSSITADGRPAYRRALFHLSDIDMEAAAHVIKMNVNLRDQRYAEFRLSPRDGTWQSLIDGGAKLLLGVDIVN